MDSIGSHDQPTRCVIELNGGRKVTTDIVYVCHDGGYVLVENTVDSNNHKRDGQQKYYKSEIISIKRLKVAEPQPPNKIAAKNGENEPHIEVSAKKCSLMSTMKTTNQENNIERMIALSDAAIYIRQCDAKYHSALEDLQSQDVIAVNTQNKFGRLDMSRPILVFATSRNVYIFDILLMGRIHKEMKSVMEAAVPRKVLFNSAIIVDYFVHTEKCKVDAVWDTLTAHFVIKQEKQIKTLMECALEYFDLPDKLAKPPKIDFDSRPLDKEAIRCAAFNAVLILKLYWVQTNILLKPLYDNSVMFANIYAKNEDRVDVMRDMTSGTFSGVEDIDLAFTKTFKESCSLLSFNPSQ